MSVRRHRVVSRLFIFLAVCFLAGSAYSTTPVDTTKEREPYPEQRSAVSDILAVPAFLLDLPFKILKEITHIFVDEMKIGVMASKTIQGVDKIKRTTGFYPVFGTGSRSGVEFGVGFKSSPVWTEKERLKLRALFSAHDYQKLRAQYRVPNFISENFEVRLQAEYRLEPWELLYGLGNTSLKENKVNYNPEHSRFDALGIWTLNHNWSLEFMGAYDNYNLYDGEDSKLEGDLDTIVTNLGLTYEQIRPTRFWSAGTALNHDWRNHKGQPTSGGWERISIAYNMGVHDYDELEFWRMSVDVRHYLEIYKKRTLAFRVLAQTVDISDNSPALPFYLKSGLGGTDNLRGYRTDRFLDNDAVLASIEYRYPLLEIMDAFLFLDEGRVFPNISNDFKWDDWKYSYGIGIRVFNRESLLVKTFVARSKEETRFSFEFANAF